MIQRRTLLQSGAAVALGAPALVGFAQEAVTLRLHTFATATSTVWVSLLTPWMNKVERDSGGRIKFQGFPSMQLGGPPAALFDQARDGVVDLIWTLPGNTPGRFPRTEVFELPFIMSHGEATSKAFWEYTQAHAAEEFREIKPIAFHVHGPGMFHIKDRPINTTADLRGLKMRGPTRQSTKLLGYLGATPVGMPLPQIPEALSRGVIDGTLLPWEVVPSIRVQELVRFHSEFDPAGGALYTNRFVLAMNLRRYNALPPDLKKVIDDNSGINTSAIMGRAQSAGDAPARKLTADRGNRINVIGLAEAQEFRRKSRQVEVEWMQDMDRLGFNGRALFDNARKLIEKHTKA